MHPLLADVKSFILDTLFPVSCVTCGAADIMLCQNCIQNFARTHPQRCLVCRRPSPFGTTHSACQTPQGVNGLLSLFDYKDERVAKAIIYGKYKFLPSIYHFLGNELSSFLEQTKLASYFSESILTPVPLAASRERWRGFNQAEIIGQNLCRILGTDIVHTLKRTKSTKVQKNLNYEQRQKNVENCFALNPGVNIEPKTYVLIDDVATTGATVKEAAKVLKRNGARSVWCITLARD